MIDPQLEEKLVPYLQAAEKKIAEASTTGGSRVWIDFSENGLTPAGQFDFATIHENFNRQKATDDYESKRVQRDTLVKDIQTSKLSIDFLAGCERDWRARTRSRVRMFVHSSVSAAMAMSQNNGPLRRNTVDWLGRIMLEEPEKE
jgi:hypothetical protein